MQQIAKVLIWQTTLFHKVVLDWWVIYILVPSLGPIKRTNLASNQHVIDFLSSFHSNVVSSTFQNQLVENQLFKAFWKVVLSPNHLSYTRYIVRNHKHQNLPQLVSFWHHLKTSMPPALLASPALKSRAATKPAEPCSQIWALETVSPLGVSCLEPGYLKGHYRTFPKLKCFVFLGFFWGGGRCSLRKSPLVVLMDSSSTPNSLILWQHPLMNGNFQLIYLATQPGEMVFF